MDENYLQLLDNVNPEEVNMFSHKVSHINEAFINEDQARDSQLSLVNHKFQKVDKQKMIFFIEEVPFENSTQSYQSSCIFNEILEFYSFLNLWAVSPNEQQEQAEKYYYHHDKAVDETDELYDRA